MASQQQHFDAARKYQEYYDETLRNIGARAPQPILGQSVNDYRRETLRTIKRTFLPPAHDLYKVNYRGLKADALDVFEPQLLRTAKVEAFNPNTVTPGEFREIVTVDPRNGYKTHTFVGPRSFVYDMTIPGRRARIWDDHSKSWFPPQSRRVA
jgi:hypothetical protein